MHTNRKDVHIYIATKNHTTPKQQYSSMRTYGENIDSLYVRTQHTFEDVCVVCINFLERLEALFLLQLPGKYGAAVIGSSNDCCI